MPFLLLTGLNALTIMKLPTCKAMRCFYTALLFLSAGSLSNQLAAQDFMMQGWYWDYPKTTDGKNWADTLRLKANELGHAGFTGIWLPPLARASFGNGSNGYDPKDLYDYGEYGGGATGFGTRAQLDATISALNTAGVNAVADLVFNHRDGGRAEVNTGVANYISNYTSDKVNSGANPFPYDRMRCILPLGGSSGNGAGDYYFKLRSASQHGNFYNFEYKVYMQTKTVGWKPDSTALIESEPNGGNDCGQVNNTITLGRDMYAVVDDFVCKTDEFHLRLTASDFNAAGDTLYISFGNRNSGYSDMRFYEIWSGPRNANIINDLKYQSFTNFSGLPSGQGAMNWSNFKPNNDRVTYLSGDWDGMYFFYDYDQFQLDTKTKLFDWTRWNWSNVGIRGLRMDAVKHFTPEFVGDLLDNLHDNSMDPPIVVGEWYSTNTSELAGWVNSVLGYMDEDTKDFIKPRIFDFSLRESLRQACDVPGYDARNVFASSLADAAGLSGFNVITFANNHDFRDTENFASLIHNTPVLAYAYLLTNNKVGLPCVFYPDYYGYPNNGSTYYPPDKNGLKTKIDQLMSLHAAYVHGSTSVTYLNKVSSGFINDAGAANNYVLTYQLKGGAAGKDVVVAINFGGVGVQFHQQLNDLAVGTKLTDVMGRSAYLEAEVKASENNIPKDIWIDLPARSYAVWIQGAAGTVAPLPASGLKITGISAGSLSMSWTDNSSNESGFLIERKTTEIGSWGPLQTVAANTTAYSDQTIAPFEHYYYRVTAMNAALSSATSNEVDGPATATWTGTAGTGWTTAGNWSSASIPSAIENVIIPFTGITNFPILSAGGLQYNHLWIKSGANLQIASGGELTVTGTLLNEGGNAGLVVNSGGSLIQNSVSVPAKVDRNIEAWGVGALVNHGWHFVSSPMSAQVIAPDFTEITATDYDFYAWWEATNEWINYKNTTLPPVWNTANTLKVNGSTVNGEGSFIPGKGYLVAYAATETKQFSGTLNKDDILISDLAISSGANNGWHLLGNPFTSAITWGTAGWALDHINGTAKIWEESAASYADIASGSGIIPALNGFMVQVTEGFGGNNALTIPAASRVHNATSWYKSTGDPAIVLVAGDPAGQTSQQSTIRFDSQATPGFDPAFDSHFLPGYAPLFYSVAGEDHLSTNTLPLVDGSVQVPFTFVKNDGISFSIEAKAISGIHGPVILNDLKTNSAQDLTLNPVYWFTASSGDAPGRFLLTFSPLGTGETRISRPISVYAANNTICISNNTGSNHAGEVYVYNMMGQLILQQELGGGNMTQIRTNAMTGYYLVKVVASDFTFSGKVFLNGE
jgi:hypothetical protein